MSVGDQLYVVVWTDRHTDDEISIHTTREGADARLAEHMESYDSEEDTPWAEQPYGRDRGWVRYVECDEEGPNGRIEERKLEQ